MQFKKLLLVLLVWSSACISFVVGTNCPSLESQPSIVLECQDPETGSSVNCNSDVRPGTIAFYQCDKHYTSPFGDTESGRMTCQSNGKWSRLAQFEEFTCRLDCGKPTATVFGNSPVVVFGEAVNSRDNFPWHVAVFRSDGPGTKYSFFCGGSLTSPSNKGFIVITAAHCVTSSLRNFKIRPLGDFRIVLGAVSSNITINEMTRGTKFCTVKAAKIHPNYNFDTIQNDVAIMKLREKVELSDFVSPVCFPSNDMSNMQIKGTGMIAGFGVDQSTRVSSTLNFARLPVTENSICNAALGKQLTSIEFCAGYSKGSSICSGDSGGGLVFLDDLSKKLYIQGIASNVDRRALQDYKYCQNYNTFTRVSSFVDWVQDQLDEFFYDDESDQLETKRPGNRPKPGISSSQNEEFVVTVYKDINDKENYVEWRMRNCSAVPSNWNINGMFWIDIHGKCLQFFEGTYCSGRSLQLQSAPDSSLFKWNFPDYNIKSVRICQNPSISNKPTYPSSPGPGSGSNSKPTGGGSGDLEDSGGGFVDEGNDYEKVGLQMHNQYRAKHGVPPVRLSEKLNIGAKNYAEQLLRQSSLQPSGEGGGENLFEITGSSENSASISKQAVDLWYNSINQYNWASPSATSFSQVVWKATKEIGIGLARSGRRTIVVARYSPPGNIYYIGGGDRAKYFRENVFRPR